LQAVEVEVVGIVGVVIVFKAGKHPPAAVGSKGGIRLFAIEKTDGHAFFGNLVGNDGIALRHVFYRQLFFRQAEHFRVQHKYSP